MIGKQQSGGKGASVRALGGMLPADHLLRRIDLMLDLSELRDALAPHYSRLGRPSIAPEFLIRMMLVGRLYGITSERRLCEEIRYNLAYRWFCRLPLGADVPHHSTFSKNRHGRFRDAGVFRLLFERSVRQCMAAGLVAFKDAAIDASFIAAEANAQRKMRDDDLAAPRLSRPVREWLTDRTNTAPQEHGSPRGEPAEVSRTDPASAWAARRAGGRFGYAMNVLVDTPGGVALDVEASPSRFAAEVDAGRVMLARAEELFDYRPKRVAADTAYGSAAFLAFVHHRGAAPHIPVLERSEQIKGKFPRAAFRYERDKDRYIYPAEKPLGRRGTTHSSGIIRYSARKADCRACHLKQKCTSDRSRIVGHSEHEDVRELVRGGMRTPLFQRSLRLRRGVERFFADAKGKRGMGRLRLRGLRGAQEEFLLGAAVANLVMLARPADRPAGRRREPPLPLRANHMARIGRERLDQSYYATIF